VPLAAAAQGLAATALDAGWTAAMRDAAASWEPVALDSDGLTEPAVARAVIEQLGERGVLVLGASMPVRDADRFARRLPTGTIVVANRGASGIDGQLGTALGAHLATGRASTALLGDLTFLHDVGGLVALKQQAAPVRLVVVNNDGGGIFSLLPLGGAPELLDPWFSAPHGQSAATIAEAFGLTAHRPTSIAELEARLAVPIEGPELIEIVTERASNAALHRALDDRHGGEVRP
jgi:2-succinyl-5-enolpyruvyl-6-hydroxy-3-cyclohexene-1-carboxylate synthase